MDLKYTLENLFEPVLATLGLLLVHVQLIHGNRLKVQIIIERLDHNPVSMDNCVQASRELSTQLDIEDPISCAYVLEVSSPGEDRPLTKPQDYQRFKGQMIKVETHEMIDNCRRFKGLLLDADTQNIYIAIEGKDTVQINFEQIAKANLWPQKPKLNQMKRRS